VVLEVANQRQINLDERHDAIQKGKKASAHCTFRKRDKSKIADLQQKDDAKSKKAKVHANWPQVTLSDMLWTNRLNGGLFPSLQLCLQDACAQLGANEPNELMPRAPPHAAMLPACCHAASMLPCCHAAMLPCCHAAMLPRAAAPLRQTMMVQVCDTPDIQEHGSQERTCL
jgi:hypothetical protein